MPIDSYKIKRQMTSQEVRDSFHEPELAWLTKDRQAHTTHFGDKTMLLRIMKTVLSACNPLVISQVEREENGRPALPRPPKAPSLNEPENKD